MKTLNELYEAAYDFYKNTPSNKIVDNVIALTNHPDYNGDCEIDILQSLYCYRMLTLRKYMTCSGILYRKPTQ